MKKAITLILLAALISSVCACSGTPSTGDDGTTTDGADSNETTSKYVYDIQDFGGKTFNYMTGDFYIDDIYVEEATGDIYDDAIFNRNQFVETTYNVKLNYIVEPFTWDIREVFMGKIRSSVMAADGAYDLVAQHSLNLGSMIGDNLFYNLNNINALQLDKEWWSPLVVNELTYNGKLYGIAGDISNQFLKYAEVFYFNKDMIAANHLENPYQLVRDGKWTFDKFLEMITGIGQDINGDAVMDTTDVWGAVFDDQQTYCDFITAFDMTYSTYDGSTRRLNMTDETFLDCFDRINDMLINNPDVRRHVGNTAAMNAFPEGRTLFFPRQLNFAEDYYRDIDVDYGILPPPKKDENQKEYYSTPRDSFPLFSIPTDAPDPEFSGAISEALAIGGAEYIIPTYFDTVCKVKNTRDEDSIEMLEIIRKGMRLDFVMVFSIAAERAGHVINDAISRGQTLTTYWAANGSKITAAWEKILTAYAGE